MLAVMRIKCNLLIYMVIVSLVASRNGPSTAIPPRIPRQDGGPFVVLGSPRGLRTMKTGERPGLSDIRNNGKAVGC